MKRSFKLLFLVFIIVWSILLGILVSTQGKGAWGQASDNPIKTQFYAPYLINRVTTLSTIHITAIDATTQEPITNTVIYAFDGISYDHDVLFGCWLDYCNGCYLDDNGTCDIVTDSDLWSGRREMWVFGVTPNLEMFKPWISMSLLNDTHQEEYVFTAYFDEENKPITYPSSMLIENGRPVFEMRMPK